MVMSEGGAGSIRVVGTVPVPRTELVGREDELAQLQRALDHARLITLVGPGGTGKSRLAAAAGARVGAPEAVAWAELAEVAEPRLVPDTLRAVLGIAGTRNGDPVQVVLEQVRDARLLVVLDNCEHLLAAAAGLVDQILDGCPRLRVLATSREPLGVDGERVWPVAPLPAPERHAATAADVRASPAGRLFELRAQAALPSFRVTAENAPAIAGLCRRLDGLPLAIELAAARLRSLSVVQIAASLDDTFELLAGGARGTPARQQSLRATLDWSHDILSERERIAFRRAGIFSAAFDLPAAEAVIAGGDITPGAVLALISRLVDRSLLSPQRSVEKVRYRLLAPVRGYACERLAAAGEQPAVADAHLNYYADLVERTEPLLVGPRSSVELDHLEADGNNLRAALAFAAGHTPPPIAGLRLAAGLTRFCALRGHYREGRQWLDWAATVPADAPPWLRAKALLGSGSLAHLQCDYPAAMRRLEAARDRYEQIGDRCGVAAALQTLGSVARELGRYPRAEALHRESLRLAEADGDELRVAQSRGYLGFAAWLQGHWDEANDQCRAALAAFRRLGDGEGVVWSLLSLGTVAQYQGQLASAGDLLVEAARMSREMSYREGIAWTAHELGLLALRRGDPDAEPLLREALSGHRALGDRWRTASVLDDLAASALVRDEPLAAVALLGAAATIRAEIGTDLAPCERGDHDRVDATARTRLAADEFARAWAHGQTAALDDLLAEAVQPASDGAGPPPGRRPRAAAAGAGSAAVAAHPVAVVQAPDRLRIHALGAAAVQRGEYLLTPSDWCYAKPRELLFVLIGRPPQTKAQIGLALWPELSGSQLRNAFHTALRDLRRALGDAGWVTFSAGRYTIDRTRDHWCDLEIFEEALAAARQARPPAAALPHLQRAIDAYRGEFGAGLPDAEWLQPRRAELARAFADALAATGRLLLAGRETRRAVAVYRRAVDHDPLDESAHRHLMTALVRVGEAGQAAQVYRQLVERLADELGVTPAAETRAVFQQLRHVRLNQ